MKKAERILLYSIVIGGGLFCFILLLLPQRGNAQETELASESEIFKARVIEVVEDLSTEREDGSTSIQQKLKLKGLEKTWKDQEFEFDGTEFDAVAVNTYHAGDKVIVSHDFDPEGNDVFYIMDYVRQGSLYWLAALFAIAVVIIGRLKGLRALIVLVLTFLIILKFIVPKILDGSNPLFISIIGSLGILLLAVYFTEGFKRTSTVAIVSIFISLVITGLLSIWFTAIARLTGFASDEAIYLMGVGNGELNVRGLLLAGIIIGALGVLDDVAISQAVLIDEFRKTNPKLTKRELFQKGMKVGVSHMSSMVNTLFLAYAGAALPLLILFSINEPPFMTFNDVINNEMIATEIVRALTGSIGLILAVPITTILAIYFGRKKELAQPPS